MHSLRILVFLNDNAKVDNKRLFERFIPVNSDIKIDFDCLISALRIMFGSTCIIIFELG